EPAGFLPWGGTVCGFEHWQALSVPGQGVLPLELGGKRVLVKRRAYLLPAEAGHEVRYQPTVSGSGGAFGEPVPPGSVVSGFACHGGELLWVPGSGYPNLPLEVGLTQPLQKKEKPEVQGHPVLWLLPGDPPVRSPGILTWMMFDDEKMHWGALQDRFNESTNEEKAHAANTVFSFPAPPWPSKRYVQMDTVKERFARHWHILLSGQYLRQGQARSRYRVSAREHLTSFGPSNLRPKQCPGVSPLVWLRRVARQGYDSFLAG
ncbi:unnamed protein product, partial [Prorocentrum cordatum]